MSKFALFLVLVIGFAYANEVEVKVLKIKLNSVDAMGMLRVDGGIKIVIDSVTYNPNKIKTEFHVKTAGIGIAKTEKSSYDVEYNKIINVIHGDKVILPGFNKDSVLTSLIIDEPIILDPSEIKYGLKINFLKAFGKDVPKDCQNYEILNFTMIQNGQEFQLFHDGISSPITEIQLAVETLSKDKKLSQIEIRSSDNKKSLHFKDCVRVESSIH
jgi:hypothetical protein